ncbi:16832_t:CDS:2, partial [Acaulospora colombiana]
RWWSAVAQGSGCSRSGEREIVQPSSGFLFLQKIPCPTELPRADILDGQCAPLANQRLCPQCMERLVVLQHFIPPARAGSRATTLKLPLYTPLCSLFAFPRILRTLVPQIATMRSTSERHRQYGDADSGPSGSGTISRPNPDQASTLPRQKPSSQHHVRGFNRLLHYIFPDKQRKAAAKAAARLQPPTTSSQPSLILPHKAWAAGDRVSAILKFTPLAKGVTVASVKMGLQEKVRTIYKNASHEEIRDAQQQPQRRNNNNLSSANATGHTSFFRRVGSRVQSRENLLGIFRTRTGGEDNTTPPSTDTPVTSPPRSPVAADSSSERSASPLGDESEDVEVIMRMRIPAEATPSHSIGPIFVTHRIKWDVLLRNHDGHYSELRCSLPIHLLSNEVLEETLAATNATRTALLGESHGVQVQEVILPAYHDHIRDRGTFIFANAELHTHVLATNPLNMAAVASAATTPEDELPELLGLTSSSYGPSSTLADQYHGGRSATTRLAEAESSELFLSLGRVPEAVHSQHQQHQQQVQGQGQGSGSQPPSQSSSRASSPERSEGRNSRHTFGIRPFTAFRHRSKSKGRTSTTGTPSSSASNSRPGSSHQASSAGHGTSGGGARSHKGHKFSLSRSSSGPSAPPSPEPVPPLPLPYARSSNTNSPTSTWTTSNSAATTSSDYYDTVPDYAFAARGFLGGGITPLSALRGLPSYNEAQRSRASSPLGPTSTVTSYNSSNSSGSRRRSLIMPGRRRSTESGEREREPVVPETTEVTASPSTSSS